MYFQSRYIPPKIDNQNVHFWENEPDNRNLYAHRGHLFGIAIFNEKIDKNIIEAITNSYYSNNPAVDIIAALMSTFRQFKLELNQLCLIVIHEGQLNLISTSEVGVCLYRQGRLAQLRTEGDMSSPIRGVILPDDLIIFSPINFITGLSNIEQQSLLTRAFLDYDLSDNSPPNTFLGVIKYITEPIEPELQSAISLPKPLPVKSPNGLKLNSFFKSSLNLLSRFRKSSYQSDFQRRSRRFHILTAFIVLVSLLVLAFSGYRRRLDQQKQEKISSLSTEIEKILSDAVAARSLSLDAAQELAKQADGKLQVLRTIQPESDNLNNWSNDISSLLSQTGSADQLNIKQVYETKLLKENLNFSKMSLSGSDLYLTDTSAGIVFKLNPNSTAKEQVTSDEKAKHLLSLKSDQGKLYLLFPSNVVLVDKSYETLFEYMEPAVDFSLWNGSFYILHNNGKISRYSPSGNSYSKATNWISENETTLESPASIYINSKVWVLSKNGRIGVYLRGKLEKAIIEPPGPVSEAGKLVVNENDELIFSAGKDLLYHLSPEGKPIGRYNLGDKKLLDFEVDFDKHIIYALASDQVIYQISY